MGHQAEDNILGQKGLNGLGSNTPQQPSPPPAQRTRTPTIQEGRTADKKSQNDIYRRTQPSPSAADTSLASLEQPPSYEEATQSIGGVATVDSTFNLPTTAELSSHIESHAPSKTNASWHSSISNQNPIAIPQITPDPYSPFLSAYPPSLLDHGITEQTWRSFLDNASATLTAKVPGRYIVQAGDAAKSMSEPPKQHVQSLVNHTQSIGKQIAHDAKRFNIFGAMVGYIGGSISIPMHMAFSSVQTIYEIPAAAISAVSNTPRTSLQQAAAYFAMVNMDWLNARKLHVVLLDTKQLAEMIHVPSSQFLDVADSGRKRESASAAAQLAALDGYIEKLDIEEKEILSLSQKTLWVVLVPMMVEKLSERESKSQLSDSS